MSLRFRFVKNTFCLLNRSILLLLIIVGYVGQVLGSDTPATALLKAHNERLKRDYIRLTDKVHVLIGYGVSTIGVIEGTNGLILIDTLQEKAAAQDALLDIRQHTDKPVKAIIYTHGHIDHIGGASVLYQAGLTEIWARTPFNEESRTFAQSGLQTISRRRGFHQAGFGLSQQKRITTGLSLAMEPRGKFGDGFVPPTHTFTLERQRLTIAGVNLELVAASGETHDQLYVWLPGQRILFAGDNFYSSFPNLYAIRGTAYRDVTAWSQSLSKMLEESPAFLVSGHTRPIIGEQAARRALTDYRDGIQYIYDKTIEGMNNGLTPNQLVEYVRLPPKLAESPYLQEYYGNVSWGVRAIFNAHLGWFDGNPSNLFPLSPTQEASRIAQLVGGEQHLLEKARLALGSGDYQWAAQLSDHLMELGNHGLEATQIKAEALEALGDNLLTATGRHYYHSVAQQLRNQKHVSTRP